MQSGNAAGRSQTLPILATLFIGCYFFLFAADGLNAYFTFDDGMNLVHLHHLWEVPLWTNVLSALKVFTADYRPLGALVYRPVYCLFGFNPLPFRIVCVALMAGNIVLAYRFARVLDATPEAATLSTLIFCYNASMVDLYYNSGTLYDLLCFPLYLGAAILYVRHRSRNRLGYPAMVIVVLLFLAALDAKEMAVTLPAVLLLYEILYRHRDFTSFRGWLRIAVFLLALFAIAALYLKAKLAEMSSNALYHPHVSAPFILTGVGHYFEELFYLRPQSCGPVAVLFAVALLLGASAALRSRAAAYGTLFFVTGLLPLSVIQARTGYAAYIAYPGLTLALGAILTSLRSALIKTSRKNHLQTASTIALFLFVAVFSVKCFAHTRKILMSNALWDEQRRIDLLTQLQRRIPEFPPDARVLMLDDPFGPDWGPMFLAELMYHNPTLWLERVKNRLPVGDRASFDLLITYQQPLQRIVSTKLFGVRKTWETHWAPLREGELTVTVPRDNPPVIASEGNAVTLTLPGFSNIKIDAIYRTLSKGVWTAHVQQGWCTLDAQGTCTVSTPDGDRRLAVDWVRPTNGRWILCARQ